MLHEVSTGYYKSRVKRGTILHDSGGPEKEASKCQTVGEYPYWRTPLCVAFGIDARV